MNSVHVASLKVMIAALAGITCLPALAPISAAAQSSEQAATRAPVGSGLCRTTATRYKASQTFQSTSASGYVNVIDSNVTFTQGGNTASCIIVSFSAEAGAPENSWMNLQAVLDGTVCQPNAVQFVRSNATATDQAARAMNFICPDVAPGSHTVRLRFGPSGPGKEVYLDYRATIVQYAK